MFTNDHEHMVEDICFKITHIEQVMNTIETNFPKFFDQFLRSRESDIPKEHIDILRDRFMVDDSGKRLVFDEKSAFSELMQIAINDFNSDRSAYQGLFDEDALEEYEDDPQLFKSKALANETPIIRKTLQNRLAKELDSFRGAFNKASAHDLLLVVTRVAHFAKNYVENIYDRANFDKIIFYKDFQFTELDGEDYTAHGVIGGGIRSTFLYKNYPEVFPCRSRMSVWALWYLVDKKTFGCKMDSEFLMIDPDENVTQQNYFYPYELFSFYALQIFILMKKEALRLGVELDYQYRFVYVDAFLNFIANQNIAAINYLSSKDQGDSYAL